MNKHTKRKLYMLHLQQRNLCQIYFHFKKNVWILIFFIPFVWRLTNWSKEMSISSAFVPRMPSALLIGRPQTRLSKPAYLLIHQVTIYRFDWQKLLIDKAFQKYKAVHFAFIILLHFTIFMFQAHRNTWQWAILRARPVCWHGNHRSLMAVDRSAVIMLKNYLDPDGSR